MAKDEVEATEEPKKKRGKKALLIPLLVLVLGLSGGGYFMFAPSASAKTPEQIAEAEKAKLEKEKELGTVVKLDPITMNLQEGHVLKVGLALHFKKELHDEHLKALLSPGGAHGKPEPGVSILAGYESLALDAAILELGNKTFEELSVPGGKAKAQEELEKEIKKLYHDDVAEVYYTVFVMS